MRHRGVRPATPLDRIAAARFVTDHSLDCRYHQRLQSARQHGRPVRWHRRHHGRGSLRESRLRHATAPLSPPPRWREPRWDSSSTTLRRRRSSWATAGSLFLGGTLLPPGSLARAGCPSRSAGDTGGAGIAALAADLRHDVCDNLEEVGRPVGFPGRARSHVASAGRPGLFGATRHFGAVRVGRRRGNGGVRPVARERRVQWLRCLAAHRPGLLGVGLARVTVYDGNDFTVLRDRKFTPLLVELTYKRRVFEVVLDTCLIGVAYYLAYALRFAEEFHPLYYDLFVRSLPIVIACQLTGLFVAGVYRGVWRYITLTDLSTYVKGVGLGTLGTYCVLVYLYRFENYSRTVFMIQALVQGGLVVAARAVGEVAVRAGDSPPACGPTGPDLRRWRWRRSVGPRIAQQPAPPRACHRIPRRRSHKATAPDLRVADHGRHRRSAGGAGGTDSRT